MMGTRRCGGMGEEGIGNHGRRRGRLQQGHYGHPSNQELHGRRGALLGTS